MVQNLLRNKCLFAFLALQLLVIRLHAQESFEEKTLTRYYPGKPAISIFQDVEEAFDVRFYYREEWFQNISLTVEFVNDGLSTVLEKIFDGTDYQYELVQEKNIVVLPREKVALLQGKLLDFSSDIYQGKTYKIGNPAEAGRYETVHLKGKVVDGKNSEPLLGATVWLENTNNAVVTHSNGNYDIALSPGTYTVQYSSLGFEKIDYKLQVISNGSFDVELFEETHKINEVAVYAHDAERNINSQQMSMVELNAKAIKQLPALTGEKDILKSFTIMPGVQSVGEFGSGFNVRGGGEDQNLYIIENAPLFNTSHALGLISVVNPDIVKEVALYKGHIPAEYGERVSSVMNIKTSNNLPEKPGLIGGIGIYNSRLLAKVPLANNKVMFKIGGRTSYSDWLLHQIQDYNLQNSSVSFYDLTTSLNIDLKKNRFTLFGYASNDYFKYANSIQFGYGNQLGSASWRSIYSNTFTGLFSVAYSKYSSKRDDELDNETRSQRVASGLKYYTAKYQLYYSGISGHNLEAGAQIISYHEQPGKLTPYGSLSEITADSLDEEQGRELSAFISDKFDVGRIFSFSLGLRFTQYQYLGAQTVYTYANGGTLSETSITDTTEYGKGDVIKAYSGLEPRLSLRIKTSEESSVKLSYNRSFQYISLLSNSSVSSPDNVWRLSNTYIKPIKSDQFAVGYYRNFQNNLYEASLEVYYKKLDNLLEYKNDADIDVNPHIETELIRTQGANYGAELMVKRNFGDLEGWVSYTYSRSLRKTSGIYSDDIINDNTWFPSSYDKPHNLSIVATYHFNKRWRFTGTFNYSTGRAVTLPEYQFRSGGQLLIYYSDRNKYRLPDYHRLDVAISVDESLRRAKKWKGSWTFSIINLYAHKNAYSVFYKKEDPTSSNNYKTYSLYKLYIIGIPFPTITYNFIF